MVAIRKLWTGGAPGAERVKLTDQKRRRIAGTLPMHCAHPRRERGELWKKRTNAHIPRVAAQPRRAASIVASIAATPAKQSNSRATAAIPAANPAQEKSPRKTRASPDTKSRFLGGWPCLFVCFSLELQGSGCPTPPPRKRSRLGRLAHPFALSDFLGLRHPPFRSCEQIDKRPRHPPECLHGHNGKSGTENRG